MKSVKVIIAAVAVVVLCVVANSCLKNNATQITYKLTSYSYLSTPKPEAHDALKKELEDLCSASTGKNHTVVADEANKIINKYTTNDYTPYTYDITISFTDGNDSGYINKSGSL